MDRTELQQLSRIRRKEASTLIKAKQYCGAYYLLGYSVECALKACIAKKTKRHDFPNKKFVFESYTHDLDKLLLLAGLEQDIRSNPSLSLNWTIIKDWDESKRYDTSITRAEAVDYYSASTARKYGILSWIKNKW